MSHDRVLPREVFALYSTAEESNFDCYVSVDTDREYRVMGDRGHETGALIRDDGIYAAMDWMPYHEPSERWTTNSHHAIIAEATFRAPLSAGIPGVHWAHPRTVPEVGARELPPGFTQGERPGETVIAWGDDQWIASPRHAPSTAWLEVIAFWVPYTVAEIVESLTNPPGPIGMVPIQNFHPIPVEEALRQRR